MAVLLLQYSVLMPELFRNASAPLMEPVSPLVEIKALALTSAELVRFTAVLAVSSCVTVRLPECQRVPLPPSSFQLLLIVLPLSTEVAKINKIFLITTR